MELRELIDEIDQVGRTKVVGIRPMRLQTCVRLLCPRNSKLGFDIQPEVITDVVDPG